MKTNRELNQQYQTKWRKIRPKQPNYEWRDLDAVIQVWVRGVVEKPQS
jgi:hypothetical protein